MVPFIIFCKRVSDKFIKDEMTVYAAQASFFILLSFFPFVMVLMTLLQFIPHLSPDMLLAVITAVIPNVSKARPLVEGAISDLYIRKGPGTNYGKNGFCPKGVYTIVETKSAGGYTWGRLKSGAGWIALEYAKRL